MSIQFWWLVLVIIGKELFLLPFPSVERGNDINQESRRNNEIPTLDKNDTIQNELLHIDKAKEIKNESIIKEGNAKIKNVSSSSSSSSLSDSSSSSLFSFEKSEKESKPTLSSPSPLDKIEIKETIKEESQLLFKDYDFNDFIHGSQISNSPDLHLILDKKTRKIYSGKRGPASLLAGEYKLFNEILSNRNFDIDDIDTCIPKVELISSVPPSILDLSTENNKIETKNKKTENGNGNKNDKIINNDPDAILIITDQISMMHSLESILSEKNPDINIEACLFQLFTILEILYNQGKFLEFNNLKDFGINMQNQLTLFNAGNIKTFDPNDPSNINNDNYFKNEIHEPCLEIYNFSMKLFDYFLPFPPIHNQRNYYQRKSGNRFYKQQSISDPLLNDLLMKMMNSDPKNRLGCKSDGINIDFTLVGQHLFFKDKDTLSIFNEDKFPIYKKRMIGLYKGSFNIPRRNSKFNQDNFGGGESFEFLEQPHNRDQNEYFCIHKPTSLQFACKTNITMAEYSIMKGENGHFIRRSYGYFYRNEIENKNKDETENSIKGNENKDENENLIVVMELPLAGSLYSIFEIDNWEMEMKFNDYQIKQVAIMILIAIEKLGIFGLVHGHINTKSILISNDGFAILDDFSLAIGTGDVSRFESLNYGFEIPGGLISQCSDLFSLGTVLYWLSAGKMPFEQSNKAIFNVQKIDFTSIKDESLKWLIEGLLTREDGKRLGCLQDGLNVNFNLILDHENLKNINIKNGLFNNQKNENKNEINGDNDNINDNLDISISQSRFSLESFSRIKEGNLEKIFKNQKFISISNFHPQSQLSIDELFGINKIKYPKELIENINVLYTLGKGTFGSVKICKEQRNYNGTIIKSQNYHYLNDIETNNDNLEFIKGILACKYQNYNQRHFHGIQKELFLLETLQKKEDERFEEMQRDKNGHFPNNHIIRLYDHALIEDNYYFFMELAVMGTLEDLDRHIELNLDNFKFIAAQMIMSLIQIHAYHLAHHDIKPINFLFGNDGLVKLADFGLARTINPMEGGLWQDTGTPMYMAPEAIYARAPHGVCVDVFSLGMTLYTLHMRMNPFAGKTFDESKKNVLEREIDFSFFSHDSDLEDFLRGILEKDAKKRKSCDPNSGIDANVDELLFHSYFTKEVMEMEMEKIKENTDNNGNDGNSDNSSISSPVIPKLDLDLIISYYDKPIIPLKQLKHLIENKLRNLKRKTITESAKKENIKIEKCSKSLPKRLEFPNSSLLNATMTNSKVADIKTIEITDTKQSKEIANKEGVEIKLNENI